MLVLAHLRNGDTPAPLAVGFGIGTTTACRYIREAVDLLAALTAADVMTFADKAYQGAGGTVRTPFKRHARWRGSWRRSG